MNNNLEFENEDPSPDNIEDNHPRTNYGEGYEVKETLEEAAERYCLINNIPIDQMIVKTDRSCEFKTPITMFIDGAKWQQEDMIEKLEMHILVNEHDWSRNPQAQFRDFIEQFKKK